MAQRGTLQSPPRSDRGAAVGHFFVAVVHHRFGAAHGEKNHTTSMNHLCFSQDEHEERQQREGPTLVHEPEQYADHLENKERRHSMLPERVC